MKTKTKIVALATVGILSVFNAQAQTALSGTGSNSCAAGAGTTNGTSIGCNAGNSTMTGSRNSLIGNGSGNTMGIGADNTALGDVSLQNNSSGNRNTAIGSSANKQCLTTRCELVAVRRPKSPSRRGSVLRSPSAQQPLPRCRALRPNCPCRSKAPNCRPHSEESPRGSGR